MVVDAIVAAAAASPDAEICGLLFGAPDRVEDFQLCRNAAPDPARTFEIDPAQLLAAHKATRGGGFQIVGYFHSHPYGPPEPSPRDAEAAAPDGALWLIVAGRDVAVYRSVAQGARYGRFDAVAWRVAEPCVRGAAPPEGLTDLFRSAFVQ
jgi:proteasome lid subunit RPN8/RPN11